MVKKKSKHNVCLKVYEESRKKVVGKLCNGKLIIPDYDKYEGRPLFIKRGKRFSGI